uniref:Uncharacterized protein n=1 Tax=Panagrolaimus davidi TaxID=227884 RepID=A0A914QLD3_9BILA
MDNLNNKWRNLEDCVNSRTQDLNAAKSLGSKFNGAQKDFTKKLGELDSAIDDITKAPINSDADIENQNKQIELIEKKLEAELEPLLFELTKLASEIEEITNDPATKSEAKNRSDSAKTAVDELKKKLDSVKKAAASAKSQGEELLTEFDKKLDWIRETQKDFDSLPAVSADPAKLNEQIEDFSSLYQHVLENEGPMVLARAKIADSLQKKPNSMLKRKLESFDEEWKPLLAGVKERYQLMEKAKKLGDELADLEVKIKNDLNDASQKIEEAKSADSNGNEMPDLTPTENLLHSLRPSLDGLLSLAKNLEQIAPGPDAKKLNREAENLVADANNLTKECSNQLKLAKARNDLRNQFEKGVIASQILIENARNNSGLSEQQDSTDSASKPLLSKEKLKLLADDLESNWIRQRRDLDSIANKLKPMIESNEIEEIDDALTGLDMNYNDLKKEFGLASDEMQETESVIGQTSEKGRQLKDEVDELVDRIRELEPIGRDSDTLKQQSNECDAILTEIEDKKQQLEQLAIEWKKLADSGKISGTQMIGPQKEMDQLINKLEQQKTKITKRKGEIEDMVDKINDLTGQATDLIEKLGNFTNDEIFKQPVASELDELRRQQNAVKQLKSENLKPLLDETEAITEQCKDLIRSAGSGIPTTELEGTLKSLGDAINDITSKVEERDRIIDSAIQGLGSYNDAYKALLNWIEEIEDLVSNQKPPSADYKVARAQLQNHDFQLKLIDDKQNSVDGFLAMIGKVEALTNDEKTKAALRAKADDISTRFV